MGDLDDELDGINQIQATQDSLIHGLSDDVALLCLARVPRKYHRTLKCVSRRWRELICSEELYFCRRNLKLEETWIYALCQDKSEQFHCYVLNPDSPRRCWKPIEALPNRSLKRKGMCIEALGKRLYLLGGCSWSEDASNEVFSYDASANTWSQSPPLSTPRCYFCCEALDEKLYVFGGLFSKTREACCSEMYDPRTSMWTCCSKWDMVPESKDSFVMDGKIYIHCSDWGTVIIDPVDNNWCGADADMASGWRGPAVVADGTLYVLDQSSGTRLMMWKRNLREWVPLGRLSPLRTRPPCRLVAVGKTIFVIGKGLSTVAIDIGSAQNVEGAMVCSSIPELSFDCDVFSCKCLAI